MWAVHTAHAGHGHASIQERPEEAFLNFNGPGVAQRTRGQLKEISHRPHTRIEAQVHAYNLKDSAPVHRGRWGELQGGEVHLKASTGVCRGEGEGREGRMLALARAERCAAVACALLAR